ncbi:hypothetical protein CEXT_290061 [Caerostris extrusa]|uniref:Uncharacterized protein n=1 Tax=Caerostris extrusa TaxID=172846 RepID=A0AAV4NIV9_CAEEX|nr:hypothetical protein CEXT_290061 [Caerostris extrusa]
MRKRNVERPSISFQEKVTDGCIYHMTVIWGKRDRLTPLADDRCSWTALARRSDHTIRQDLCLMWWQNGNGRCWRRNGVLCDL